MHRTAIIRDAEATLERYHAGTRLDEQQRLAGYRVVQFLGVFGVITADADDLAEREVDGGTVDVLVLRAHHRLLCCSSCGHGGLWPVPYLNRHQAGYENARCQAGVSGQAKILPGFMIPLGSNTALSAFMQAISAGERLYCRWSRLVMPTPCSALIEP